MASNNADDPWDWGVDRVVQELCTYNRSWSPAAGLISPDPALLEQSLRENDINGVMIVQYVNKQSLKDDLGINNLNQRSFLWCAIEQFQQSSPKWQVANPPQQAPQSLQMSELSRSLEGFLKHYPQHASAPTIAPSAQQLLLPAPAGVASLGAQLNGFTSILQDGHEINGEPGSKRRKLDIVDPAGELPPQFEDGFPDQGGSPAQNDYDSFHENDDMLVPSPEPTIDDLGGHISGESSNSQDEGSDKIPASEFEEVPAQEVQKKPKKIAPTWVCAIDPNRNREILTAADDLNFDRGLESEDESVTDVEAIPEAVEDGRKRLAPNLISSDVNGYMLRELSANADHLLCLVAQDDQSTDNDTPAHESDAAAAEQLRHENSVQHPSTAAQVAGTVVETVKPRGSRRARRHLAAYLGKDKLPVDDLFYKGINFGQDLQVDTLNRDDLEFVSQTFKSKAPPGQSRYVGTMMRNFMLSKQDVARGCRPTIEVNSMMRGTELIKQTLTRASKHPRPKPRFATNLLIADIEKDGNVFTAVRTYPEGDGKFGLMSFFQTPSFTLYYQSTEGEIRAKREKVVDWPQLLDGKDRDGFKALSPLEAVGMRVDVDPDYLLAKYGHQVRLLPAYGDSGSEDDENDAKYWREIEKELGEQIRTRPKNKPSKITSQEIDSAIDEAITKLIQKWQEHKLPKLQKTAWSVWKKSRQFEQEDIEAARQSIRNLDLRIETQRKEFHTISWSNYGQAVKQGRIMEQTIFDRELLRWKISVIEQEASPEKLPKVPNLRSVGHKAAVLTDDDEDGESIHEDDSDDGMGDFVITDEEECVEVQMSEDGPEDQASVEGSISTPIGESDRSEQAQSSQDEPMQDVDELSNTAASNVSTPPRKRATKNKPPTSSQVIDLTMDSDSPPHAKASTKDSSAKVIDLCTPEKPQIDSPNISKGSAPKIRLSVNRSSSPYDLSSSPDPKKLPPYDDPIAIARYSYHAWSDLKDRNRLLIRVFYKLTEEGRKRLLEIFDSFEEEELWSSMKSVMLELSRSESSVKGDPNTFDTLSELVQLYLMFMHCKFVEWGVDIPHYSLKIGLDKYSEWFPLFYKLCSRMRGYLEKPRSVQSASPSPKAWGGKPHKQNKQISLDSDDDDEGPTLHRRAREITEVTSTEDDVPEEESPHLKRKRLVVEDAGARDLRERNRLRLAEQEERRTILKAKLAKHGRALDKGKAKYIINDAAALDQGHIYIYKEIADHIKKHQIEGVRFMWNQIVTDDEESMQGCLLAHTMGLGKTMQTITLLVAIAEAASSPKHSISSQIPDVLKVSKTLVLCPPTLIDNWVDELLMWAPRNLLGSFWKLTSGLTMTERLETIREWYEVGGVLVIGYEMFRNLMNNSKARLTDEQHDRVVDELLNGPNIVVADEAHKMKNAKSKVTKAASQFRAKARIALTGSPLANNVEEYHAMINFTSPNYLGSLVEFKAKYKDPIEAGLYSDSTAHERRKCLKMLGLLNSELELKVHRAGMLVLRDDLPKKKEFVLSLPLTDIQRKVYSLYVKSLSAGKDQLTKDGEVNQTTLWSWLATLSLLCNHPYCFDSKLHEKKEGTTASVVASRDSTDQEAVVDNAIVETVNVPLSKTGLSKAFIEEVTALFKTQDLLSIELSHKVTVLCQILDAAKSAGDKTLVFSSSIPTLDFLEALFKRQGRSYKRLDGSTAMAKRQGHIKAFNKGDDDIYLISTTAGGLGLNLQSANRVVIFDFKFNPTQEEQAVGRAYRIGQLKPTFVYRFVCGGTFESNIHNKVVFKSQLASRVVDKKSVLAYATKKIGDFLYEPKEVPQQDLSGFQGMDPLVLDKILASQTAGIIRSIIQTDTFEMDDEDKLTPEEQKELDQMIADVKLKRNGPRGPQANYQAQVQHQNQPMSRPGTPTTPLVHSVGAGSARPAQQAPNRPPSRSSREVASSNGFGPSHALSTPAGMPVTNGPKVSQVAEKCTPMSKPNPVSARAYAATPRDYTSAAYQNSYASPFSESNPPILGANTRVVADSPPPNRKISEPPSTDRLMSAREPEVRGTPSRVISMTGSPGQNNRPASSALKCDSFGGASNQSTTNHSFAAREQENSGTSSSKKPIRNLVPVLVTGYKSNASGKGSSESRVPDRAFLRAKEVSDEIRSTIASRFPSGQVRQKHLDLAFNALGSNLTKCQELIDSKLSVNAFLRSLPEPVVAGPGSDLTKSAMYKAMNGRPPVHNLKTPVVKAPKPLNPNARDDHYEMERINQRRRASGKAELSSPLRPTRHAKVANAHHSRSFSGASIPLSKDN